jgi:cell wall-associated NlpC family hydrolase
LFRKTDLITGTLPTRRRASPGYVLGGGNTDDHVRRLRKVTPTAARPGDLVFYGKVRKRTVKTHHVGIYIGSGKMINALRTGTTIRTDRVTLLPDLAGYYRYEG